MRVGKKNKSRNKNKTTTKKPRGKKSGSGLWVKVDGGMNVHGRVLLPSINYIRWKEGNTKYVHVRAHRHLVNESRE